MVRRLLFLTAFANIRRVPRAGRGRRPERASVNKVLTVSEASADREVMDDATLLLAHAQLESQAYNDAKTTLRAFIRRFPKSPHINEAKAKLAETELFH